MVFYLLVFVCLIYLLVPNVQSENVCDFQVGSFGFDKSKFNSISDTYSSIYIYDNIWNR